MTPTPRGRGRPRLDPQDATDLLRVRLPLDLKTRLQAVTDNASEFAREAIERAIARAERKQAAR